MKPLLEGRSTRQVALLMIVALISTVTLLSHPSKAQAYNLFGCKWPSSNVKIQSATVPSGYGTPFANAMNDWGGNTDVNLVSWSGGDYNIRVSWVTFGNVQWSGIAAGSSSCAAGTYNQRGQIQINRHYTDGYTSNMKRSVITHEIGHYLGVAHSGSSSTACSSVVIMHPHDSKRRSCGVYSTKADDRRAVNSLY